MREFRCRIAAAVAVALMVTAAPGVAADTVIKFDLPAQSLAESLKAVANQTSINILFDRELVDGLRAPALAGELTSEAAISKLLSGTRIAYELVNEHTIVLTAAEQDKTSQEQTKDPSASVDELEEIVVAGSRLLRATIDDSPIPVTVFDRRQIDALGVTSVADVLDYLPQQPFANGDSFATGGSRIVRLRGLGVGASLVLINGRRTVTAASRGTSPSFDLNSIPLSIVERIEVLSNSASAVYGADAVGGVVNIVLKDSIAAPTIDVYYGTNDGGGAERQASAAFGVSGPRYNLLASFDYYDRDVLPATERDRARNADFRRFGFTDQRQPFSNPGNISSLTPANLPGLPSRTAAVPAGSTGVGLTPASFLATAGQTNLTSLGAYSSLTPETDRKGATLIGEFSFTDSLRAFGEFTYSDRYDLRLFNPPIIGGAVVPATNPFNPFGVAVSANFLLKSLDQQGDSAAVESFRTVLGLAGDIGDWDWEVAGLKIDETADVVSYNSLDQARVTAALNATNPSQALNVFQDGPGGSQQLLESLLLPNVVNRNVSDALQWSAQVRGRLFTLPAGPVQLVVGAETREESLRIELQSAAFLLEKERDSMSAFAEARVPIVAADQQVPLIRDLTLTLAGRYDDYDDFGDTTNPQYGLEWRPFEPLLLRAAYSTSYRAPSLFELYQPNQSRPGGTLPDPRRGNLQTAFTNISGGNADLEPETADSVSAGFVLTPFGRNGLRIGGTYWSISQDERVARLTPNLILNNEALFPGRVSREAPTPADIAAGQPGRIVSINTTSVNFGSLDTSGIDLDISNTFQTGIGSLTPALFATWVESFSIADVPRTPAIERVGIANSAGTVPKWRASAALTWKRPGVSVTAAARYTGSYQDASFTNIRNGRTVGDLTLFDLQAQILAGELGAMPGWLDGFALRLGAQNLFDKEPPLSAVTGGSVDASLADLRGRFLYAALSKRF